MTPELQAAADALKPASVALMVLSILSGPNMFLSIPGGITSGHFACPNEIINQGQLREKVDGVKCAGTTTLWMGGFAFVGFFGTGIAFVSDECVYYETWWGGEFPGWGCTNDGLGSLYLVSALFLIAPALACVVLLLKKVKTLEQLMAGSSPLQNV